MRRRIIFMDIDGTLTEPGSNEPPESAIWAINQARKQGHYVFLCTGRNYDMLSPLLKYEFDGIVASSGGYIECQKEVIYDCPMTEEQRLTAMAVLKKNRIFQTIECMDGAYTDEGFKEFLRNHAIHGNNSELLRWREQIEKSLNILPMKEYRGQPVYKIVIMSQSREQLIQPQKALESDFDFCIQDEKKYGFVNGELVNRKFDKGKAVERVCNHLHFPLSDSVAIGDSMNDREMLKTAGLGICMQNGDEGVKNCADDICPSVHEDGIRDTFLKYHLIHDNTVIDISIMHKI